MLSHFSLSIGHLNIFLENMSSSSAQVLIGLLEFPYFWVVWDLYPLDINSLSGI